LSGEEIVERDRLRGDVPALERRPIPGADQRGTGHRPQDDPQVSGPALAEGLQPSPDEEFDEELWRARIGRWVPELVDPAARSLSWPLIAAHHQWIDDQLKAPVTVATIAQRLRDDHRVEVSESTVRRYIATTFAEERLEGKVTVPRGAVEPGSEAQIDYGTLGMWLDPASGRRVAVWVFAMILSCSRALFVQPC
jgi:hypothetical protein